MVTYIKGSDLLKVKILFWNDSFFKKKKQPEKLVLQKMATFPDSICLTVATLTDCVDVKVAMFLVCPDLPTCKAAQNSKNFKIVISLHSLFIKVNRIRTKTCRIEGRVWGCGMWPMSRRFSQRENMSTSGQAWL